LPSRDCRRTGGTGAFGRSAAASAERPFSGGSPLLEVLVFDVLLVAGRFRLAARPRPSGIAGEEILQVVPVAGLFGFGQGIH